MLNAGDRVGLIGKNGAGKSTMLKLLSRELKPDTGGIATDKDVRIGFLKQDIDFVKGRTILEEATICAFCLTKRRLRLWNVSWTIFITR